MNVPLVIPGLLPIAIGAALWARWLARNRERVLPFVRHVPRVMFVIVLVTMVVTAWGVRDAFRAVASSDASTRASRLADGISLALNATAIGYCVVLLTLLLLLVATLRAKKPSLDHE